MNKYTYPVILLACALIVGGSVVSAQYSKQKSIEKQKTQELEYKQNQDYLERIEKSAKKEKLQKCLDQADEDYWSYMKLNGTEKKDGVVMAENYIWDRAAKKKQTDIDNCRVFADLL